ncbi:unnamed protein product [Trypanosoma congolense IL3000]|uniref:WGS project CAEQ00000000 data, annotated contig 514 n=1 Tax=Trypanosoma congolense (strain IL3000) TaxID=1068625 RepID=F9WGL3_TRYCI|nr:unnamed protein product [Trypanosoma congolense IL3000]
MAKKDKVGRSQSPEQLELSPERIIITDASTSGWGAIVLDRARHEMTITFGARWPPNSPFTDSGRIAEAEAQALVNAWQELNHKKAKKILFVCDNPVLQYALLMYNSGNTGVEKILEPVLHGLKSQRICWMVQLVPSKENPADEPSRQKGVCQQKIDALLKNISNRPTMVRVKVT